MSDLPKQTIAPGQTIHALFLYDFKAEGIESKQNVVVAMETCDN